MGQINRRTWRFDSDICAGLSTEYQDLSTRHDWPVKRAIVRLANQRGVEFIRSPELGSRRCFPDVNIQHQDRKRYNRAVV